MTKRDVAKKYGDLMLTNTERDLLRMRSMGARSKEIAAQLNCSPRTVESHFANALRRNKCATPFELLTLYIIWSLQG